jgi:hypothetical protein
MAALQLATIILAWGKCTAPLAGLIFVLGELQRHFTPTVFGATFEHVRTAYPETATQGKSP